MFEHFPVETRAGRAAVRVLVVADDLASAGAAQQAIGYADAAVAATLTSDASVEAFAAVVHADLLLVEASAMDDAALDHVLPAVRKRSEADRARIVVALGVEQIDRVAAYELGAGTQLLVDPRTDERVTAILLASGTTAMLHDASREAESTRLRKLNDEVARIADTLARLSRGEMRPGGVSDRELPYQTPVVTGGAASAADIPPATIRAAIRARRMRAQFFDGSLFADPAWDMLLDLFAARLERVAVSVSSLCIAAAVPPTTALRWIATMTEAGLFERENDPVDRRRAFVTLSASGFDAMARYARATVQAGLPVA